MAELTPEPGFLVFNQCVCAENFIFNFICDCRSVKKIKIFGWLDRLAGLALSFGEAYLLIGLVGLFLQMPFITNGMQYVNSIPYMDVPIHTVDNLIEVFSKGEISFETLKDAILE